MLSTSPDLAKSPVYSAQADTRTAYSSDPHLGRTSHDNEADTTPVRRLWDVSTSMGGMERRPRVLRSYVS